MSNSANTFAKKNYFPTHVFQIDIANSETLNKHLVKTIYAEREKDRDGIARSNFKELGSWHSHNNLHKSAPYSELVDHITDAGEKIGNDLGFHKDYNLQIGTMWSVLNPPGGANRAHVHPGCLWSGAYYVQAPKDSGSIEFVEPRTMHLMNQPRYVPNSKRPKECWTKVRFAPIAGRMLIFPAWLYHAVDPNMTEETGDASNRIVIAFNLNQRKK